jgi:hypothetical protein
MVKIGLIDVDGHNFPNLPLMKISAWHKARGDQVEWYDAMFSEHQDRVYMSKVFSFSPDYEYHIRADEIVRGGSGYCINLVNGKEVYDKNIDIDLPPEIEHIYPDYSLYGIEDCCYGFLSRGCPRGCDFCHVKSKEGTVSRKVANLSEFWRGQKNIVLCDPNILACKDWKELLQQLIDSKAWVDFNQGLDIRLMTEEKAEMLKKIKMKEIHFAWDRYEDKDKILPKLKMFKDITGINERKAIVYVLCNFNTTLSQDLERVYTLRDELGYWPYIMLYDKENIPQGHDLRKLQRWVNNRFIFAKCRRFEDYQNGSDKQWE